MTTSIRFSIGIILALLVHKAGGQALDFTAVRAGVYFDQELRDWDGFGFNYVETAHSYDMDEFKQEYGGFSLLDEKEKQEIIEMVFGEEGLKVGLVKMFLGANHQKEANGPYDHRSTTENMRYFVQQGLKITRQRGDDLKIITTLYGPPGFMTLQKANRGRDLDPAYKEELVDYMIDWIKFLKNEEQLPVQYISLHNEGEDWHRWNQQGLTERPNYDYNLYWPPSQVNEFIKRVADELQSQGLTDVAVTNGEPSNWYRFYSWGYADALAGDKEAVDKLGIITSHGFYRGNYGHWFAEHNSNTNDLIRRQRPDLHSWVTSTSWKEMTANFIKEMHGNIYTSQVNGIIPWAGIQRPTHWVGGDPNPGSAFTVREDGTCEVRRGYYFYKQLTRAGQPGMAVAKTFAMNSEVAIIGFAHNDTNNPDSFLVINIADEEKKVAVEIKGSDSNTFSAFRTIAAEGYPEDRYNSLGQFKVSNGMIVYEAPPGSVTTFFGQPDGKLQGFSN